MSKLPIWLVAWTLLGFSLYAQQPKVEEPPEEDVTVAPREREYTLNPIQAEEELKVGRYYQKKGSFKAAAMRYEEATKWNPSYAEAWLLLGEMREKLKDSEGMAAAYEKYLDLEESPKAEDIRRKLQKISKKKS